MGYIPEGQEKYIYYGKRKIEYVLGNFPGGSTAGDVGLISGWET